MRISHKYKFIFIAIPKTGSTVIRNHLDSYSDVNGNSNNTSPFYHHVKADTLKSYFVENKLDWSSYFKFSFLRTLCSFSFSILLLVKSCRRRYGESQ